MKKHYAQLADLPITTLPLIGTDNLNYRIGDQHLFRQPLSEDTRHKLQKEVEILPLFEGLSLNVPRPVLIGDVDNEAPLPWAIFDWIDGADGALNAEIDTKENAILLGNFLREMRKIPALDAFAAGPQNNHRGVPLSVVNKAVRDSIEKVDDEFDELTLVEIWQDALAAKLYAGSGEWLHGDLHAANLLFDENNKICAVIDWGLAGVGDPAADLTPAWWIFSAETRQHFFDAVGADENEIRRGRGWALHNAVIAYAYYRDRDKAQLTAMSRAALVALLSEA
jgi:aminoglycoside phosphotransferase (APT) family kinase protein